MLENSRQYAFLETSSCLKCGNYFSTCRALRKHARYTCKSKTHSLSSEFSCDDSIAPKLLRTEEDTNLEISSKMTTRVDYEAITLKLSADNYLLKHLKKNYSFYSQYVLAQKLRINVPGVWPLVFVRKGSALFKSLSLYCAVNDYKMLRRPSKVCDIRYFWICLQLNWPLKAW